MFDEPKYIFTEESYYGKRIEISLNTADIDSVLETVHDFMRACGYSEKNIIDFYTTKCEEWDKDHE